MERWFIAAMIAFVVFFGLVAVSCNATLCQNKGGHLTISLLNSAGYACVDENDRIIPLP